MEIILFIIVGAIIGSCTFCYLTANLFMFIIGGLIGIFIAIQSYLFTKKKHYL